MRTLMITLVFVALLLPNTAWAQGRYRGYSVPSGGGYRGSSGGGFRGGYSGGYRGYSAPSRSYSSTYRGYSVPTWSGYNRPTNCNTVVYNRNNCARGAYYPSSYIFNTFPVWGGGWGPYGYNNYGWGYGGGWYNTRYDTRPSYAPSKPRQDDDVDEVEPPDEDDKIKLTLPEIR